jgi:putative hemolysin
MAPDLVARAAWSAAEAAAIRALPLDPPGAEPPTEAYDADAVFLGVFDDGGAGAPLVACRITTSAQAERLGQFDAEDEYDIASLRASKAAIAEFGRVRVRIGDRVPEAMRALRDGLAAWAVENGVGLLFGRVGLAGMEPDAHADVLTHLYYRHLAPRPMRPRAMPHRYIEMRRLDRDEIDAAAVAPALPPFLAAMLEAGAVVGDGAIVDPGLGRVDVAVVLAVGASV